jgi:hypothetical protein
MMRAATNPSSLKVFNTLFASSAAHATSRPPLV